MESKEHIVVEIIEYLPDAIVSKTVIKRTTGNTTITSFATGQESDEKFSQYDNYIQIIEGVALVIIDQKPYTLRSGNGIVIPAQALYSIHANVRFKMISTTIKSGFEELIKTLLRKSKSILLIEDDKNDQFFFIEALREIKFAKLLDIAENGEEALHKLSNSITLPDLIFSDIHMPIMNGVECLAEIIKNPLTKNIPVVILSSAIEQIEIVRKLGAQAFIKKPNSIDTLRERVEELIHLDFAKDGHIATQTFHKALMD